MKKLNAKQTLDLISKQYADTKDIQKLAECGADKARQIKKEIIEKELQGWLLPKNEIPMCVLVEYLKIDIEYLRKVERDI